MKKNLYKLIKQLVIAASHASGSLYVTRIKLDAPFTVNDQIDFEKFSLQIVERVYLDYGLSSKQITTGLCNSISSSQQQQNQHRHLGSFELKLFRDPKYYQNSNESTFHQCILDKYRLVSHDFGGTISVWNLANQISQSTNSNAITSSSCFIVRSFRTVSLWKLFVIYY